MIYYSDLKVGKKYRCTVKGINKISDPFGDPEPKVMFLTVSEKHDNMIGFRELHTLYHRNDIVVLSEVK